jgi:hypothetical protein
MIRNWGHLRSQLFVAVSPSGYAVDQGVFVWKRNRIAGFRSRIRKMGDIGDIGDIVPGALHHSITAIAQPGREPLMGQRVSYPLPP